MKEKKWVFILILVNLFIINWVVIRFLNFSYPMVGHDYGLTIPGMLDILLHYKVNGLNIQWYTPTFGGGVPAFPDPNNGQFSLLGLLPLLFTPWQAVIISSIIYISSGGLACYYLLRKVLNLDWTSSLLGMVFFLANGLLMQRIAAGHIGYQTFPMIALILIALLDSRFPRIIAALIFSLLVTMLIHFAGYFLIVVFGLTILILLPIIFLHDRSLISWKRVCMVILVGGGFALVMSSSKLAAVYAFMRFFPRQLADSYTTSGFLQGLLGIIFQLLGTMNLVPILKIIGIDPALMQNLMLSVTGAQYGFWEFDMSLSPVVFVILILGLYGYFRKVRSIKATFFADQRWIAWSALIFFTWLAIEFTLAKGLIYPFLQKLPILSSLHVNPRFAAAFLFPLALTAALFLNRWQVTWERRKTRVIFLALNLLTLIPLSAYFLVGTDMQTRSYDLTRAGQIYESIRSGDDMTITGIVSGEDNTGALLTQQSNLRPYWPIFGYRLENFHPEIVPGSIWLISGGYYNMTNPAGYVFPELNGTRPFERIPVSDRDKLEAFASHMQPDWMIPLYQQILNWISGLVILASVLALGFLGIKKFCMHNINRATPPDEQ